MTTHNTVKQANISLYDSKRLWLYLNHVTFSTIHGAGNS